MIDFTYIVINMLDFTYKVINMLDFIKLSICEILQSYQFARFYIVINLLDFKEKVLDFTQLSIC